MNQYIINTLYKIVGIGLMSIVVLVGIIGIVKVLKQINKQKDKE